MNDLIIYFCPNCRQYLDKDMVKSEMADATEPYFVCVYCNKAVGELDTQAQIVQLLNYLRQIVYKDDES